MNLAIRASGKLGFTVELPANEPTERSGSIHAASVTLQEVPSAMCVWERRLHDPFTPSVAWHLAQALGYIALADP